MADSLLDYSRIKWGHQLIADLLDELGGDCKLADMAFRAGMEANKKISSERDEPATIEEIKRAVASLDGADVPQSWKDTDHNLDGLAEYLEYLCADTSMRAINSFGIGQRGQCHS